MSLGGEFLPRGSRELCGEFTDPADDFLPFELDLGLLSAGCTGDLSVETGLLKLQKAKLDCLW